MLGLLCVQLQVYVCFTFTVIRESLIVLLGVKQPVHLVLEQLCKGASYTHLLIY